MMMMMVVMMMKLDSFWHEISQQAKIGRFLLKQKFVKLFICLIVCIMAF